MNDNGPCCAHCHIAYNPVNHADGTMSERWSCTDCGTGFIPEPRVKLMKEFHIMQLAAISTVSRQNTEASVKERIGADSPYYTAAYEDVARAIDREMKHRKDLEEANQHILGE